MKTIDEQIGRPKKAVGSQSWHGTEKDIENYYINKGFKKVYQVSERGTRFFEWILEEHLEEGGSLND